MRNTRLRICVLLAALLQIPAITIAQNEATPSKGMWANVKRVPVGDELVVTLKDGKNVKGRLSEVSDTTLVLTRGKQTNELEREKVLRVYRLAHKSAATATLIGAGVGFAAGAGIGAAVGVKQDVTFTITVPVFGGIGAAAGALAGYAIGSRQPRVLIYDAKLLETLLPSPAQVKQR